MTYAPCQTPLVSCPPTTNQWAMGNPGCERTFLGYALEGTRGGQEDRRWFCAFPRRNLERAKKVDLRNQRGNKNRRKPVSSNLVKRRSNVLHQPQPQTRAILKGIVSPIPCGIGMYEQYISDDEWIIKISRMMPDDIAPRLFMDLVEESILEGFGKTGYEVSLSAICAAKQALSTDPVTDTTIYFALADLLVGLRQALSQSCTFR